MKPELHKFEDDLKIRLGPYNHDGPPRKIRARDLDGNFRKVTVIDSEAIPPDYRVKPTKDGIILTDILPQRPTGNTLHVLAVQGGVLRWVATQDCE